MPPAAARHEHHPDQGGRRQLSYRLQCHGLNAQTTVDIVTSRRAASLYSKPPARIDYGTVCQGVGRTRRPRHLGERACLPLTVPTKPGSPRLPRA